MTEKNIHRHYTTMLYRAMSTTTTPHTDTHTDTNIHTKEIKRKDTGSIKNVKKK